MNNAQMFSLYLLFCVFMAIFVNMIIDLTEE